MSFQVLLCRFLSFFSVGFLAIILLLFFFMPLVYWDPLFFVEFYILYLFWIFIPLLHTFGLLGFSLVFISSDGFQHPLSLSLSLYWVLLRFSGLLDSSFFPLLFFVYLGSFSSFFPLSIGFFLSRLGSLFFFLLTCTFPWPLIFLYFFIPLLASVTIQCMYM